LEAQQNTTQNWRFGVFEVDGRNLELRRSGALVKVREQSFRVLVYLIEHAGEIVSREDLCRALWPADTFVDFDHSLNTAIKKLRDALGDDADAPIYIETIPRRGYRFIAPVSKSGVEIVTKGGDRFIADIGEEPPLANPPGISEKLGVESFAARDRSEDLPETIPHLLSRLHWKFILPLFTGAAALAIGGLVFLQTRDYFWRNPIADARFQKITDLEGVGQAAAVSRDGHLVAFLSDRDGPTDVWVTQVGSGQFHNLTHGIEPELANPSLRTLGFSPDGSLVTFWVRKKSQSSADEISIWAVPTLGGEAHPYLEGAGEFDWSLDGSRLAYHTSGPGDPLFISDGASESDKRRIFTAPEGLHSHFPIWSPDKAYIYFVQGTLPDKLDIWRISSNGGAPQRITSQNTRISYPVFLDQRTLLYLAPDPDGSGPWLYGMDVEQRIPHKLSNGLDPYASLAASADGHRLVITHGATKKTLWRLRIGDSLTHDSDLIQIPLTTASVSSPRLGPNYLVYVSDTGTSESVWKLDNGVSMELWSEEGAHVIGAPAIASDGQRIAVSVQRQNRSFLYVMQADGTNARILTDALDLQGAPAWSPDGKSITVAANDRGIPHLFRVSIDGGSIKTMVRDYSVDPVWEANGQFLLYSGPDIGTTFSVKSVTPFATPHPLPQIVLTRGARHLAFLPGGQTLIFMLGEIQHKDIWTIDLKTGAERQLTSLPADFNIRDFDISPDGREVILERTQEPSEVVLLDLPQR
jgi:Tol biopolymer transport system component/DNA-binding winged helix-turn-helix (wHTH) protein